MTKKTVNILQRLVNIEMAQMERGSREYMGFLNRVSEADMQKAFDQIIALYSQKKKIWSKKKAANG